MIPVANRFAVVLDASVLFPQWKRDILLRFHEADLFRARWTDMIQNEWLERAKESFPHLHAKLYRTDLLMRQHFEDAWVDRYQSFIECIDLPDPGDRHVVAAAIACKANYIVTDNIKDFPATTLAAFEIEAGTADAFLSSTFDHYQSIALADLRDHRRGLASEPSTSDYLMKLRAGRMPLLSARLYPFSSFL